MNSPPSLAEQGGLAPWPTALSLLPRLFLPEFRPPGSSRKSDGFRETWLRYFTRSEDQAALRHLSRLLRELILEFRPYLPKSQESSTRGELLAAAADLRFLGRYLVGVAGARVTCELTAADAHLPELAERLALGVDQIALEIEAEMAGVRA